MNESAFPKIQCPTCHTGEIAFNAAKKNSPCTNCSATFPVENGILNLLPKDTESRSFAQFFMEWEPLINIYESLLWRKNPIFTSAFTGLSFKKEFKTVVKAAKLSADSAVLDLACGSGIYSRPLSRKLANGSVIGLDLSIPMLNYASSAAGNERINNFIPVHGNALNLPFPENQFDAVICCGAFHLFPDHDKALSEIIRVLKPLGRFVTAVFYRRIPGAMADYYAKLVSRLNGIHPFRPEELKEDLLYAGFADIKLHHAKRVWMIMSAEKP